MAATEMKPEAGPDAPSPTGPTQSCSNAGNGTRDPCVLVRDSGFQNEDWCGDFIRWNSEDALAALPTQAALDVENTTPAESIVPTFERIALIRIAFPSHMDGRGFSLARHLRLLGYRGRLRACGRILADQYAMARRSGFDEVEIDRALSYRQPEEQWLFRANWRTHDYQARLGRCLQDRSRG